MNEELNQGLWSCPVCGAANSVQSEFCKNCGHSISEKPKSKRNVFWVLLIGFLVLVILAGASYFGYSYYKKKQETKDTKTYLEQQQAAFGDMVKSINGLTTETDINKKYEDEENRDLIVSKLSEEYLKAEKNVDLIKNSKKQYESAKKVSAVSGVDFLLKDFYADADKFSLKYREYMEFLHSEAKANVELEKEFNKFSQKFKNEPLNIQEVIAYWKGLSELYDGIIAIYEKLKTPEQLKDYRNVLVEIKRVNDSIKEMVSALEKEDYKKVESLAAEMDDVDIVIERASRKANELVYNYYSQIHDEFASLRSRADKIKSEMIMLSSKTEVKSLDFSIEGW